MIRALNEIGNDIDKAYADLSVLESNKLQTFRVSQKFVSPHLMNATTILDGRYRDGFVYIKGMELFFERADEVLAVNVLKDEDEIVFWVERGYFTIARKEDYSLHSKDGEGIQALKKKIYKLECEYSEAEFEIEKTAFYAQYEIPFKFLIGVKPVRSGYNEGSAGNGCNLATVYHIVLNEDIETGRLKRNKGDFLCTNSSWLPYGEVSHQESNMYIVKCKACLQRLEKYKINQK